MRLSERELSLLLPGAAVMEKKQRKKPAHIEHDEQVIFFNKVDLFARICPEMLNITAIPNGGYRPWSVAKMLKSEGVKAGYPDILVDLARHGFHGMRIEMKTPGEKPKPDQVEWHKRLKTAGYYVVVCFSGDEAWNALCDYMGIKERG